MVKFLTFDKFLTFGGVRFCASSCSVRSSFNVNRHNNIAEPWVFHGRSTM
jgi:hypothetical protein